MRNVCSRCRRPESVCYCDQLPVIDTRTRVVLLQHARERRVAIGTARMAHVALKNSELLVGVDFNDNKRLQELAAHPERVVFLYPGEGIPTPRELEGPPPEVLVVVDGTWPQSKKLLKMNPLLGSFRRVGLLPEKPSNYRIRKEPAEHCLSTIEAVVQCLDGLEGNGAALQPMLEAFARMVDFQLEGEKSRTTPPRRRIFKGPRPEPTLPEVFTQQPERLVCVYAEANAYPRGSGFEPELVQLVAVRPATGERIELFAAPRNPLAANVPAQLEVPPEALLNAPPIHALLERMRAFSREGDVTFSWGYFSLDLLRHEGLTVAPHQEARRVASQFVKGRLGSLEQAAERIDPAGDPSAWAHGRAGGRIRALERIAERLLASSAKRPSAAA